MAAQLILSNRLKGFQDAANDFGQTWGKLKQLRLENERQAKADAIAQQQAEQAKLEGAQRLKLGGLNLANAEREQGRALEMDSLKTQFSQADAGQVMGPQMAGDFQAGLADEWAPLKDRLRAQIFTQEGTPTTAGELKTGREEAAFGRGLVRTKAQQSADESAADIGYKKALTTKALTEKTAIEKPVKWTSKVDAEGNAYQENPITGETRYTGMKAPIKMGSVQASKEEMDSIKEQSIAQIDELLKHPGFSDAVGVKGLSQGYGLRSKPIEGSDAAGFLARLEQIQGGSFLQARQMLKGGGQVTDFEGKKAESAMSRMSAAVSEKEFLTAAKDYKDALEAGLKKLSPGGQRSGASGSFGPPSGSPKFKILSVE